MATKATKPRKATKTQALAALRKIRETLSHKAAWAKGADARTTTDDIVCPLDESAVQFCIQGAAVKVIGDDDRHHPTFVRVLAEIGRTVTKSSDDEDSPQTDFDYLDRAVDFNDHDKTSHQALLGAIDRTINRLTKS